MAEQVLAQIWCETFESKDAADLSPVAQMLSRLMAAPLQCFRVDREMDEPVVMLAGEEVIPGASLADILFEEHLIEVSDDTVIYIEPASMVKPQYCSKTLGQMIGEIMVRLSSASQFDPAEAALTAKVSQIAQHRPLVTLTQ